MNQLTDLITEQTMMNNQWMNDRKQKTKTNDKEW